MPCYARQRPLEKFVWTRLLFLRISIHMQKNNLITSLILEILDFQESCNLSDWLGTFWVITQKQEFFQTRNLQRQVKDDKKLQNLPKSQHSPTHLHLRNWFLVSCYNCWHKKLSFLPTLWKGYSTDLKSLSLGLNNYNKCKLK